VKYLSICAIVRNEAPYIAEWLEFHRLVGVERFYIYDDVSEDDTIEILLRRDRGDVRIFPWGFGHDQYNAPVKCRCESTPQTTAYNHCARRFGHETRWLAFIDVDEYLYHATEDDLRVPLRSLEGIPALFVHWLIFGRNGHQTKPPGLTIEEYTRRALPGQPIPYGEHGKLILQPDRLDYFGPHGSHNAVLKNGMAATEEGMPVAVSVSLLSRVPSWRLNHYYNRSEEEARAKVARVDRNAAIVFQPDWARMEVYNRNDVEDRDILRFLPRLREALA
jgi:hypothetical protein